MNLNYVIIELILMQSVYLNLLVFYCENDSSVEENYL